MSEEAFYLAENERNFRDFRKALDSVKTADDVVSVLGRYGPIFGMMLDALTVINIARQVENNTRANYIAPSGPCLDARMYNPTMVVNVMHAAAVALGDLPSDIQVDAIVVEARKLPSGPYKVEIFRAGD